MHKLALILSSAVIMVGCGGHEAEQAVDSPATVLMIGCDGVSWNVLQPVLRLGMAPALERLAAGGGFGAIQSLKPMISPRIWNSVVTGRNPEDHGIVGFLAPNPQGQWDSKRLLTSRDRKTKAIWNILSERGLSAGAVGWWSSWPAEEVRGPLISMLAWPYMKKRYARLEDDRMYSMMNRLTFPENLQAKTILDCRSPEGVTQEEIDRWDLGKDPWFLAKDQSVAAQAESAWMRYRPDFMALYLQGIDASCHAYWYHPTRVPSYYRFTDELVGRLIDMADEKTTVVFLSDHGFRGAWGESQGPPASKPRTSKEARGNFGANRNTGIQMKVTRTAGRHMERGVLMMAGLPFRRSFRIRGAGELDITPTLLPIFDLPVGSDMSGKTLMSAYDSAFTESHPITTVATYETGDHPIGDSSLDDSDQDQAVIDRLRSLGYIL